MATVSIGGAICACTGVPLARCFLYPTGVKTVASGADPIDVGPEDAVPEGGLPVKVQLSARNVRDGWSVAENAPLGAAWLVRGEDREVRAFSSACPHLGCAVDFDPEAGLFRCPCHTSSFDRGGERLSGPAKRGLDPLPLKVADGRIQVTFKRYRPDTPDREEV